MDSLQKSNPNRHINQMQISNTKDEESSVKNQCKFCGKHFRDSYNCIRHLKNIHLKDEIETSTRRNSYMECPTCKKHFTQKSGLNRHIKIFHNNTGDDNSAKNKCELCGKHFRHSYNRIRHIKRVHLKKKNEKVAKKKLTCVLCKERFSQQNDLQQHLETVHSSQAAGENLNKCDWTNNTEELKDKHVSQKDKSASDNKEVSAEPSTCTALKDGILCQCCNCSVLVEGKHPCKVVASPDVIDMTKPFRCEPCNLRFRYKSRLDRHLRLHAGIKSFPCDICGSAFTKRICLEHHKLYKHTSNPFKETCNLCDKVFVSKSSLNNHIANVHLHRNKNRQYKCNYCKKIHLNKDSHLRHIRSFHDLIKEYTCAHCNKTFNDRAMLVRHIKTLHLPSEEYKCEKCDRVFKTKQRFTIHNNYNHSDSRFGCEICGKILKRKKGLEVHMATHSDDKPFICQTCGKGFKREMNLTQHQHTHSDVRPHKCNICGLTFKLRTHIKQHMAVHGIADHICFSCNKSFTRKTELNSHLLTHKL